MKRIAKLSIIMLLMMVCLTVNVYAKPNCTINMATNQTEVSKGKEFTIDVNLSNIQSERGIIAIEATLEYEKDCLTLSKMEGQNGWDTPIKDLSYNESNGKLVIDKKGLAKNDETILKITFVVNDTNKKNTTVSLKNIIVADGTAPATISNALTNVTIKEETNPNPDEGEKPNPNPDEGQKPDPNPNPNPPNPDDGQKPDPNPNPGEDQKPDIEPAPDEEEKPNTNQTTGDTNNTNKDNVATGKLPQTGKDSKNVLILVIALSILIAIVFIFIYKSRRSNKKY